MTDAPKQPPTQEEILEDYYSTVPQDGEYYSRCEMNLPPEMAGKRVLDIECRKGKGAYAISDQVVPGGSVIGVDSSKSNIENAIEWAPKSHWAGDKWEETLSFKQGFPENLRVAGIEDNSIDIAIINSVINVVYDRRTALREIFYVLKPGGYLYLSNIFLNTDLPDYIAESLRRDGGVFGAALTFDDFSDLAQEAGFTQIEVQSAQRMMVEGIEGIEFAEAIVKFTK